MFTHLGSGVKKKNSEKKDNKSLWLLTAIVFQSIQIYINTFSADCINADNSLYIFGWVNIELCVVWNDFDKSAFFSFSNFSYRVLCAAKANSHTHFVLEKQKQK